MKAHCNYIGLVLTHAIVALGSPLLGVVLFLLFSFGIKDSVHFGGIVALGFGALLAYLIFGFLTVLAVLVASPFILAISRVRNAILALLTASCAGGLVGWLFCTLFVAPGEGGTYGLNAKLASCITGVIGAIVLERSWRTKLQPEVEEPQIDHIERNPMD